MQPHSLAVKHGTANPRPKDFPFNIGDCGCTCGAKYAIFVNHQHYADGARFCAYIEKLLKQDHNNKTEHAPIIELPMEAELER